MESDLGSSLLYQSYLLRLRWVGVDAENGGDESGEPQFECRVMLQSIITRETAYFRDLESCLAFLKEHRSGTSLKSGEDTKSED